ncbi:MAG: nucleotidyltransferase, partial [Bacteroidales bacterium]|nr:nucleotidyltransferase [Bacteroidales bacterium]
MRIEPDDMIFQKLSKAVTEENVKAYVVGGWVRDYLLKRDYSGKDIDIVVLGSGTKIAKKIAKRIDSSINVSTFKNFDT